MPLIGKVAAGSPIPRRRTSPAVIRVSPLMFKLKADYLLKVQGMSMKDVGIVDGDWLAVHKRAMRRMARSSSRAWRVTPP